MSIQSTYLNELAEKFKTDITEVLINNSISITSFTAEVVSANQYELTYNVDALDTTLITNIKLRKSDTTVISNNDVNIPVTSDEEQIRQLLTVSEVIA
jgi:hypothetical protein